MITLKKEFKESIKCGTGKAYLLVKNNPSVDFSKEIIHAATHNLAYDRQSEGDRAEYLYEIINLSNHKEIIINSVLSRLLYQKDEDHDLNQMCEIARLCAQDGNNKARQVLYKRFAKYLKPGYEFCGADSIITLDGLAGFLMVADIIGQQLKKDPNDWEDGWREDNFEKENTGTAVYKFLAAAAKKNSNIKAYLASIKDTKRQRAKNTAQSRKPYTLVDFKDKIATDSLKVVTSFLLKDLSDEDFKNLADDFLKEKQRKRQEQYLRIFRRKQFPYHYNPILQIAQKERTINGFWGSAAVDSLSLFTGKDIRRFALEKISGTKRPWLYLDLLIRNYKKGDSKLLVDVIGKATSLSDFHIIGSSIVDIYDANPTRECKKPIEAIYEKMNCGIHREDLVRILIANNVLSEKIKKECIHDSYKGVRNLVREIN